MLQVAELEGRMKILEASAYKSTSIVINSSPYHAEEMHADHLPEIVKSVALDAQKHQDMVADTSKNLSNASTDEVIMQLQSRYKEAYSFLQSSMI